MFPPSKNPKFTFDQSKFTAKQTLHTTLTALLYLLLTQNVHNRSTGDGWMDGRLPNRLHTHQISALLVTFNPPRRRQKSGSGRPRFLATYIAGTDKATPKVGWSCPVIRESVFWPFVDLIIIIIWFNPPREIGHITL